MTLSEPHWMSGALCENLALAARGSQPWPLLLWTGCPERPPGSLGRGSDRNVPVLRMRNYSLGRDMDRQLAEGRDRGAGPARGPSVLWITLNYNLPQQLLSLQEWLFPENTGKNIRNSVCKKCIKGHYSSLERGSSCPEPPGYVCKGQTEKAISPFSLKWS